MAAQRIHSWFHFALMAFAVAVAVIVSGGIIRISHVRIRAMPINTPIAAKELPPLGVTGTLRAGDASIQREWDALDITLPAGQSIDESLSPSQWEGEFNVTFRPGKVRYARVGAIIEGGSLIVMRDTEVLLSDYAPAHGEKTVLTRIPLWLPGKHEQITFMFKSDGTGRTRLSAVWQPEGISEPVHLPIKRTGRNKVR